MKIFIRGLLLLPLLLSTYLYAAEEQPKMVRVAVFNNYPAVFRDQDGQIKGYYIDAMADLSKRENLKFNYIFGTLHEGLNRIKTGAADILLNVAKTADRSLEMDFTSIPLQTVWGELYVRHETVINSVLDTDGMKIAIVEDDINGRNFIELNGRYNLSSTFVPYRSYRTVLKAVADRQVEAGVVSNIYGDALKYRYDLRSSGILFDPYKVYIAAAKGENHDLLQLLDHYLDHWQRIPGSVYETARKEWSARTTGYTIQKWLKYSVLGLALSLSIATAFILLLRRQVWLQTEDIRQQHELQQEKSDMIQYLLDSTAEAIYGVDLQGNCTFCNSTCLTMLGYQQPEQLLGKNMHDLIHHTHPDGSPYLPGDCPIFRAFLHDEKVHVNDEVLWRSDNSSFFAEYWSHPIKKGEITSGAVVTFIDITERVKLNQKLRASEERYRNIFEKSYSVMLVVNPVTQQIVDANQAATKFYGWSREQLCRMKICDINILKPEQIDQVLETAARNNRNYFNFKHRLKNGLIRDVEVFSAPLQYNGLPLLFSIVHDITERLNAENALLESEARYRTLVNNAPMAIYVNQSGRITLVNLVAQQLFGVSNEDELLGKSPYELFHPDYHAEMRQRIAQLMKHPCSVPVVEMQILCSDGKAVEVEVTATSFQTDDGMAIHVFVQDISHRKEAERSQKLLEEQLRHSQRMEAIGTLAGGIAHDFNNILTAIIGYSHIGQMGLAGDAPQHHQFQQINDCANRASKLTGDLLIFSRKQSGSREQIELGRHLSDTGSFLKRIIGENITLNTELPDGPVMINADPQQLDQVLMNLGTNARDAMPSGGTITINLQVKNLIQEQLEQLGLTEAGDYAVINFSDTGCGIPQDLKSKIFDPFFTTKEVGKGTGLGLSIIYGIINAHQGSIKVASNPDDGSTFTIYLPCAARPAQHQADRRTKGGFTLPSGDGKTILVAEDDYQVRDMVFQTLSASGYHVLLAKDGEEAIQIFKTHADQIDLLLLDLMMPHRSGYEAWQQISQISPAVSVIFYTGYSSDADWIKLKKIRPEQLIIKPFSVPELLTKVYKAINIAKE